MDLTKCHGSGNDFFLLDRRLSDIREEELVPLAVALSQRSGAFGADGLLVVEDGAESPRMRILNADGSEAEMCGNGLRCVARYLMDASNEDSIVVETLREMIPTRRASDLGPGVRAIGYSSHSVSFLTDGWVRGHDSTELQVAAIPSLPGDYRFTAIRFPNPHLIGLTDEVSIPELKHLGEIANTSPAVFPEGINVSLVRPLGPRALYCATSERGVGLTHACGTAMSAATVVAAREGLVPTDEPVEVFTWGGRVRVSVAPDLGSVEVEGNATIVYTTSLTPVDVLAGMPQGMLAIDARAEEVAAYDGFVTLLRRRLREQLSPTEYALLEGL